MQNYAIIFGVRKKSYKLAGAVISLVGAAVVFVGTVASQIASADPVVAERADWSLLLMVGGGILIIAGITLTLWLFVSD